MKTLLIISFMALILSLGVSAQSIDQPSDSLDSTFANPTNLTDKQMDDAQNFTHQGIKDRAIKEGCAKVDNCNSEEDGLPLETMIGKAYAMIGMFTGSGGMPSLTKKPKDETSNESQTQSPPEGNTETAGTQAGGQAAKAEKETTPDFCMMGAMAWETLGGFIQQNLQQRGQNEVANIEDKQLQSLQSLKQTHLTRAKTAGIQRTAYAAVTACYAGMWATGKAAADAKFFLKMGGSTALTLLYQRKIGKHKKAAKLVQDVIDSLPKAGDCNPWTGTSCFCSEKTSKDLYPSQYQEICILNGGNFDVPKVAIGCGAVVNNKIQYDKECKCKQNNSCLKSGLKAYNPKFPFGNNLIQEANKTFDLLNSGEFDEGKLDVASTNAAALAAKIKPKLMGKFPKPKLTPEQQKIADGLKGVMPAALANVAAASNGDYTGGINDSGLSSSAISKLPASVKEKLASAIRVNYRKGGGNTQYSDNAPEFTMPKFPGQEQKPESTEVLSFAEEAISKADVSNSPSTPIFDIISNRYRKSGWKKLETVQK